MAAPRNHRGGEQCRFTCIHERIYWLPECAEISHKALVAQCEMIQLEGTVHKDEVSLPDKLQLF